MKQKAVLQPDGRTGRAGGRRGAGPAVGHAPLRRQTRRRQLLDGRRPRRHFQWVSSDGSISFFSFNGKVAALTSIRNHFLSLFSWIWPTWIGLFSLIWFWSLSFGFDWVSTSLIGLYQLLLGLSCFLLGFYLFFLLSLNSDSNRNYWGLTGFNGRF